MRRAPAFMRGRMEILDCDNSAGRAKCGAGGTGWPALPTLSYIDGRSHWKKPTLVSPFDLLVEYLTNLFHRSPTVHLCDKVH